MSDLNGLRNRVETTAERLAAAQQDRRRQNGSLLDILGRLEQKFAAQEQELAFYRERVGPLEAANAQLSMLMQRLLDLVDAGLDGADDLRDPVHQATEMAAAMLQCELVSEVTGDAAAPIAQYDDVDANTLAAENAAEARFEDADQDELAAEAAADVDAGDSDLPQLVRLAIVAAKDAGSPDSIDRLAETLGGEAAENGPLQPTADDIRALLERVEAAAERMAVENDHHQAATPAISPAPARHVAGAAA